MDWKGIVEAGACFHLMLLHLLKQDTLNVRHFADWNSLMKN